MLLAFEWVCWCPPLKVDRMLLTELLVDLRPRRPEERRYEEWGVRVPGERLVRLALTDEGTEPVEELVLILGLAGIVALACNSGLVPTLDLRCCGKGPVEVRCRFSRGSVSSIGLPFASSCGEALSCFVAPFPVGDFARLAPSLNQCFTQANWFLRGCW